MRVLFLQRQPCVRALKYAVSLRGAMPDLDLGFAYQGKTLTEFYGTGDELFDGWWNLGDEVQPIERLAAAIAEFEPDVIHSHNLPDVLTVLALDLVGETIPVVHDIHDLQSLRATPYRDGFPEPVDPAGLERTAIEGASAVITVSPELVDVITARYRLPDHTLVLGNLALRKDRVAEIPRRGSNRIETIVYEGSLATDAGHYDLRDIFRGIADAGLRVAIHPSRHVAEYVDLALEHEAVTCHDSLDPSTLMSTLPRYDLGWAGFNTTLNGAHLDTVLPNKLFEYLGAGLPVVTMRDHLALSRFVDREAVGIVIDSIDDLADAVADADLGTLRATVAAKRDRYTFEAQVAQVIALYGTLTEQAAPGGEAGGAVEYPGVA